MSTNALRSRLNVIARRNGTVSSVPSSFHDQPVARSGTTEARLFCFTCWSNMIRLLNTPIIGPWAKTVASSRIDMLAGLSGLYILRMPPCFWANAVPLPNITISSALAAIAAPSVDFIYVAPCLLFVEPDVFHAPAVVDAVDHQCQPLDLGPPTDPSAIVVDDRPRVVLRQLAFDFPRQGFALLLIGLHRLLVDQLVDCRIAVAVIVSFGTAGVILIQALIGVV